MFLDPAFVDLGVFIAVAWSGVDAVLQLPIATLEQLFSELPVVPSVLLGFDREVEHDKDPHIPVWAYGIRLGMAILLALPHSASLHDAA